MIDPNQPTPKPAPIRERHKLLFAMYGKERAKRRRARDVAADDAHCLAYWRRCGVNNLPAIRKTRGA